MSKVGSIKKLQLLLTVLFLIIDTFTACCPPIGNGNSISVCVGSDMAFKNMVLLFFSEKIIIFLCVPHTCMSVHCVTKRAAKL